MRDETVPGMRATQGIWSNVFDYHPFEPVLARAEGVWLYDTEGRAYLDGSGGAMSVNLGHGDPRMQEAVASQAQRFAYCHPLLGNLPRAELCARISEKAPDGLNTTLLCSGGSEAVETAIKLARQYHLLDGQPRKHIVISRRESYHGMSLGALSLSGTPGARAGFTPMLHSWDHICQPSGYAMPEGMNAEQYARFCARQLEEAIYYAGADQVAAFIATPLGQGEDYGYVPPASYWQEIRAICDRYGVLLIADEVVTGWGRTGHWFAMAQFGVTPDILVTAKGISGCFLPLSAVTVSDRVNAPFARGGFFPHAYTAGGNPLSCAAGLAAIAILEADGLIPRAAENGAYLRRALERLADGPLVAEIRGQGLLQVLELVADRATRRFFAPESGVEQRFRAIALSHGLALFGLPYGPQRPAIHNRGLAVCLAPPLCISRTEIDFLVDALEHTLHQLERETSMPAASMPAPFSSPT